MMGRNRITQDIGIWPWRRVAAMVLASCVGASAQDVDPEFKPELVAVEFKHCSPAWKAVKAHIQGDEKTRDRFVKNLKKAVTD